VHEFDTPGKTRLRVRNAAGLISVDPSETGRTTVVLEALRDDDATREAIERATVELDGNEVLVEIGAGGKGFGVGPAWISFGRTPQVGVRIRCPEGADLDCMTASADIAATGRLGEVEVKTASGDVAVEHVAGLRVQSASGDVRGTTIDGDARLQTVSGDVRLGTVTGEVTTTLVSGDFAIDDAHTDLSAKSVSGDQRIGAVRAGQIKVQSVSGDVRLGVRPGTRLHIDANSVSGDVSSEFDVKDTPSETSSSTEARLQIKTVSGDVEITRAA
jgi:Putative adhesin